MAGFQARLRVRIIKPLSTTEPILRTQVRGRIIEITSGLRAGQPLTEADWLVFKAGDFASEAEALIFGEFLKNILNVAGVWCRLGIDLGNDKPSTWIDENFARSVGLLEPHERTHPNVHGLVILEDDPNIRFPVCRADATVQSSPTQLLDALQTLSAGETSLTTPTIEGLRLLNQAILNPQPWAQIVLAISAVEALGQGERWTSGQKALISEMADRAAKDAHTSEAERAEVAEAIQRNHRFSLRQGVKRLLYRLGMPHLQAEWDRVYNRRSSIFHGTLRLQDAEIFQLGSDAVNVCSHIILALAARDDISLSQPASVNFPTMQEE